jgi:putative ABC transport system ATP-binding protein
LLRPAVILADEPTNDLDARRAAQVADFLLGLPADGYALVLVTHDTQLAERAGNCWRIDGGKLMPPINVPEGRPSQHAEFVLQMINDKRL